VFVREWFHRLRKSSGRSRTEADNKGEVYEKKDFVVATLNEVGL